MVQGGNVAYLMVGMCAVKGGRINETWDKIMYETWRGMALTCVGVRWIKLARCSRSGADRYFCCLNLLSNS